MTTFLGFLEGGGLFLLFPVGMYLLFWLLQKAMGGGGSMKYQPHEVMDVGPIDREKARNFRYVPTPVKQDDPWERKNDPEEFNRWNDN